MSSLAFPTSSRLFTKGQMDVFPETKSVRWEVLAETPGVFRTSESLKKCLVEPGARGASHVLAHTPRLVELFCDRARSRISCFPESQPCQHVSSAQRSKCSQDNKKYDITPSFCKNTLLRHILD